MIFKDIYLRLSIKKQIVIGVLAVTMCTNLIITILITINSFIFFHTTVNDVSMILDSLEDRSFGSFGTLYDLSQVTIFEYGKRESQLLRNFITNYDNRKSLYTNIDNTKVNDYFATSATTNTFDCLKSIKDCRYFIYNFNSATPVSQDTKKGLMLFIPVARLSIAYKTDLNFSLLQTICYSMINTVTHFLFPFRSDKDINAKFTIKEFIINYNVFVYLFNTTLNNQVEDLNSLTDPTLEHFTTQNPFLTMLDHDVSGITLPYATDKMASSQIISFKYKAMPNNKAAPPLKWISDPRNLVDYISYELSGIIFDQMSSELGRFFPGVSIMASLVTSETNDTRYITTINPCYYLRKIYSFYSKNALTDEEIFAPAIQFEECFFGKTVNETKDAFNNDKYNTAQINRKKIVSLTKTNERTMLFRDIEFKIIQYINPSQSIRRIFSSYFDTNFISINYVFKNRGFLSVTKTILTRQLYELILVIILMIIVFWIIIHLIIFILSYLMANTISKPFDELLERISSRGNETDEYYQSDKLIEFKYDSDINELFKICDGFLKGGFQEESKRKKTKIVNAYNNISLVKTNNLLFNEKEIYSKKDENMRIIFEYGNIVKSASKRIVDKEKPNVIKLMTVKSNVGSNCSNVNNQESNEDIGNKKKDDLRMIIQEKCEFVNEKTIAENEKNEYYSVLERYLVLNNNTPTTNLFK